MILIEPQTNQRFGAELVQHQFPCSGVSRQLWRKIKTPEADSTEINPLEKNEPGLPDARTLDPPDQGFPAVTDDQYNKIRKAFIESLDPDAVCALASKHNNSKACQVVKKASGSFNVCFFVEFDLDGSKWIVRVPIEPALDDPWDKLLSEVTTMQYLECNTQIPVPHIRAYGRDITLTKNGTGTQMFTITDLIPGEPLDRKFLIEAKEEHRRNFYSQLIDSLTELRKLEFPSIGSLMPNPDGSPHPVLGPVLSMSAATLRQPPQPALTSAKEYMKHRFSLISSFFSPPVSDHTVDEIKQEIFALDGLERIFQQVIDPRFDDGPFVLNHLDLRSANIIVDESLRIQGIIDWEFATTVPLQMFAPPSWITGHDSIETDKQMHIEFRDVLDEKSKAHSVYDQLKREWYECSGSSSELGIDKTDMAFCVAHVLRRPANATDIFCDFFAQKLSEKHLDDIMSDFFDRNQELASEAQRRAEHCERYTQYLKENGLYETESDKLLAASKALKEKWGWS
ncbi:hypothetical protein SAPIO_CDS4297 [Scedosporium apiospermum]|uniref:Aminoglycoside phosphotransferase domain-containing protein n=1 Tax=Pseudallescheria apiosperma TaxID=563466 RepID=A0A084G8L9_PSEDA|nr:uncharacterized protein SAPIO_CDS4297 [Scedosporium apiospermum]KEZ43681.1 hypothetical protein SAPIO_CDS4297 [Scedosporium apiospermum]